MHVRAILAGLVLTAVQATAQAVHVVDGNSGPGTDFTSVSAAVAAAADGDVILVRGGTYFEDVVIDDKSLVVQGEIGQTADVQSVVVADLSAGKTVVVRDMTLAGGSVTVGRPVLNVHECAGTVWFEGVRVSGVQRAFTVGGGHVRRSDDVYFVRCQFEAPVNLLSFDIPALQLDESTTFVFDTTIEGEDGAGFGFFPLAGMHAIEMTNGELWLYDVNASGGDGQAAIGLCGVGAPGGDALVLDGIGPTVHLLGVTLIGGTGGEGSGGCGPGSDGGELVVNAPEATVLTESGTPRGLAIDSPVRENATTLVVYEGVPGESVWVRVSSQPGTVTTSSFWDGPFFAGQGRTRRVGSVPPSGTLFQNVPVGALPPGTSLRSFYCQAIFLGGRFTVSPPSMLVLLDESL